VQAANDNRKKIASITRSQELRQAEARLAQAMAEEDLAKKELNRFTALVQAGAASQESLDQVKAQFDVASQARISAEQGVSLAKEGARLEDRSSADAAVDQAQAALKAASSRPSRLASIRGGIEAAESQELAAEEALRRTRILLAKHVKTAPFSGRILSSHAELGMTVSPGTPLVTLGETSRLKLRFSVPEDLRPTLEDAKVTFTVPSLVGRSFSAEIRAEGFQADPRTHTFSYEAVVPNPQEQLLPGMVAEVLLHKGNLRTKAQNGVSVPIGALAMDGTAATVFVINPSAGGDRVEIRRVLVARRDGLSALISQGLGSGERVVLSPKNLADGESVRMVNQ
jgi:RND family efflux transporter MFP subunit